MRTPDHVLRAIDIAQRYNEEGPKPYETMPLGRIYTVLDCDGLTVEERGKARRGRPRIPDNELRETLGITSSLVPPVATLGRLSPKSG